MTGFIKRDAPRNPVHEEINSYGGRSVVTAGREIDAGELRQFATELMSAIAAACAAAGAKDVSHVKAYIEYDSGFIHADTVGEAGQVRAEGRDGNPTKHFGLVVNAVVYGMSAEGIREATEATLDRLIGRYGFEKRQAL